AVGLVAAIGLAIHRAQQRAECEATGAAIDTRWSDPTKAALAEAFAGSGAPDGAATWARVAPGLDAWTQAWREARAAACLEAHDEPEAGHLRQACLERHRGDLMAFVGALAEPTAVVVHRAASAAQGLPSLEDCEDETALLASADRDATHLDRAVELDRGIGRARALRTTGQAEAARAEIDQVIEQAGVEDLRPVTGRALLERAYLHRSTGDMAAAELDLRAAYFNAVADRRARVAATAAVGLVDVLAALHRTDEALAWSEHARAHIDALERATALDAALRQALAHVGVAQTEQADADDGSGSEGSGSEGSSDDGAPRADG
ncbi:MAG: hypothetical protein KDK70_21795, partial [Myxococcales bacterium]|nr:hypothetical protein [Myxococcales bacterium]